MTTRHLACLARFIEEAQAFVTGEELHAGEIVHRAIAECFHEAQAIGETLRRVVYHEQLTGQVVQNLSVPSTGVAISHGLGRTPIGWYLTDVLDAAAVKRTAWDSKTITLQSASGTVRCDVFVW